MKQSLVILFTLLCTATLAQQNSSYSRFGVGTIVPQEQAHLRSMGYISTAYEDSIQTNLANPASLGSKIFSSLDVGFNVNYNSIQDQTNRSKVTTGHINYLAYSFPANKKRTWGMAIGAQPFSSKDYEVSGELINSTFFRNFEGSGNTYKFFLQNGVSVSKNLRLGVDAGIFFGTLNDNTYNDFLSGGANSSAKEVSQKLRGINLKLGGQYTIDLPKRTELVLGSSFNLESELNNEVRTTEYIYRLQQSSVDFREDGSIEILSRNPIFVNEEDEQNSEVLTKEEINLPAEFSVGAFMKRHEKWSFGVDAKVGLWDDFEARNDVSEVDYQNSYDFSLGGSFIPNYRNPNRKFEAYEYRYGGHYSQSYLEVEGTNIRDFGVTLGVSLPIKRTTPGSRIREIPSNLDLGIDIGQRGTLDNNLVQESYIKGTVA